MNKKTLLALGMTLAIAPTMTAQRVTDALGRGLVAMKTDAGVFCSWRINANEWDDGTLFNIYRGSTKLNSTPLSVSNFTDTSGSTDATYTIRPVVNGVEADACAPVKVWEKNYTIIKPQHAPEIKAGLVPNDATAADVDGDGELEIIMKYDNQAPSFGKGDNGIFTVVECLEMDGSVKWWINFGPNIGDFQNNEINIIATDWDGDGKAEVVFRAADGTVIHQADGSTFTVGDASINYRGTGDGFPSGQWFMHWGKEYLIYANGETCKPYECIDYPLMRVEPQNNPQGLLEGGAYDSLVNNEWGDGYGHRSSKYFFGAPYLDGRKPSLFLARGIYTKHKMIAYDIDPETHKLVERWRWNSFGWPWEGQGYHNFGIADVDWDGRDEIVYGSMVIDDNGNGLSTTGLGHGDAQHCGDFDPYTHGQEIFACNEDQPNNNFRDATTSKIYYRTTGGNDDGRSNMGNFIDEYPGAEGLSSRDGALVGGASHKAIEGDSKNTVSITQNFRVYWDGDLCDESFDYNSGKNTQGAIYKAKGGKIAVLEGSKTNNDTKGTPCFQGDILGDWREEYIMRDGDNNIRIFSTDFPTEHRIYSLWYDHQYRNAMNWQMCGYNQPPHISFWLSVFEDITVPPAPLTMTGRTEVANNGSIDASLNGKHVIVCETNDMTLSAADGVAPSVLTVNTPTWVEGHNNNNYITTQTFTHTISSGTFGGDMKLIKQGDGKLVLPAGNHPYSGKTEVWAGTLALDGELTNSPVWLNRFGMIETNSLNLPKGLDMHYASVLKLGTDSQAGTLSTGDLKLGFGAIVEIDAFADQTMDRVNASKLTIEKKDWTNGPEYLQPIVRFTAHPEADAATLPQGRYLIGEIGEINGNLDDLVLLGIENMKKELVYEDGKLYVDLSAYVAGTKTWAGIEDGIWDLGASVAFTNVENGENEVFVPGDHVIFDDSAANTDVVISGRLQPESVTFRNNEKDYTLSGEGQIVGDTKLVKEGSGNLTISNINSYTGGTDIKAGKLTAGVFSNTIGNDLGALSDVNTRINISNGATLAVNASGTLGQKISMPNGHAVIEVNEGVTLTVSNGISAGGLGQTLYKRGKGTLNLGIGNTMNKFVIEEGAVNASESGDQVSLPKTVEFIKGALYDPNTQGSYSTNSINFVVDEGNSGSLYCDPRSNYKGTLTGKGSFTVYAAGVRNYLQGNWSAFEGDLTAAYMKRATYDPDFLWDNDFGMPKATLNVLNGVSFNAGSHNLAFGNIKGMGTINTTGSITVGNDNTSINYPGSFAGDPAFVKTGACDLYMGRKMTGIRSVTANDGTVSLQASKTPYNTQYLDAPLTIEGNAKLRGRGAVANLNVLEGGTVEPGTYSDSSPHHYGPIFATGNVNIAQGGTLSLYLRVAGKSNDCSYLNVKGMLKIDGDVKVTMNPDYVPAAGDQFQLWITGSFAGTPNIILPELPAGLAWDFSGLKDATGILKVVAGDAVSMISAGEPVVCKVYDTAGIYIGSFETTKAEAAAAAKRQFRLRSGLYMLRLQSATATETIKMNY
ncbi:MAG: autotransporter-associated beta strand repeat-containing protein [Muribaculaceae bacterium]|nr:autotransporter-associated beta strand repeat-containing protein [Muribaculaceae bacterium]